MYYHQKVNIIINFIVINSYYFSLDFIKTNQKFTHNSMIINNNTKNNNNLEKAANNFKMTTNYFICYCSK